MTSNKCICVQQPTFQFVYLSSDHFSCFLPFSILHLLPFLIFVLLKNIFPVLKISILLLNQVSRVHIELVLAFMTVRPFLTLCDSFLPHVKLFLLMLHYCFYFSLLKLSQFKCVFCFRYNQDHLIVLHFQFSQYLMKTIRAEAKE